MPCYKHRACSPLKPLAPSRIVPSAHLYSLAILETGLETFSTTKHPRVDNSKGVKYDILAVYSYGDTAIDICTTHQNIFCHLWETNNASERGKEREKRKKKAPKYDPRVKIVRSEL